MICQHCEKDTGIVYVDGRGMTRQAAEEKNTSIHRALESLEQQRVFAGPVRGEREERWEKLLAESSKLETALGFKHDGGSKYTAPT